MFAHSNFTRDTIKLGGNVSYCKFILIIVSTQCKNKNHSYERIDLLILRNSMSERLPNRNVIHYQPTMLYWTQAIIIPLENAFDYQFELQLTFPYHNGVGGNRHRNAGGNFPGRHGGCA
jgi:hypothetical protein